MKIRMTVDLSGTRNGQDWPRRNEVADLPDDEAAGLCAAGMAVPVADHDADVETAVPDEPENRGEQPKRRGTGRPRKNDPES